METVKVLLVDGPVAGCTATAQCPWRRLPGTVVYVEAEGQVLTYVQGYNVKQTEPWTYHYLHVYPGPVSEVKLAVLDTQP